MSLRVHYIKTLCSVMHSKTCSARIAMNRLQAFTPSNVNRIAPRRHLQTGLAARGLMEFFDDRSNWGATRVRVGRGWTRDELRLKSNQDLHKLWYVLLKERNMLFTMQYFYEEKENEAFPNPERVDKVEESMENLEAVVKERNKAYYQLEVSEEELGSRPVKHQRNQLGLPVDRPLDEHVDPETEETRFKSRSPLHDADVAQFLARMDEKQEEKDAKEARRQFRHVIKLFRYYPDLDLDLMKRQFPDVDVEAARLHPHARGNRHNLV